MQLLVAIWMVLSSPGQPELHKEYYDSGTLKTSYVVEGSNITVFRYYPTGTLREQGTFIGADKHGTWTSFAVDGTVEGEAEYQYGQPTGTWRFWYTNGQLRSLTEYDGGKAIDHQIWNREGQELSYAD